MAGDPRPTHESPVAISPGAVPQGGQAPRGFAFAGMSRALSRRLAGRPLLDFLGYTLRGVGQVIFANNPISGAMRCDQAAGLPLDVVAYAAPQVRPAKKLPCISGHAPGGLSLCSYRCKLRRFQAKDTWPSDHNQRVNALGTRYGSTRSSQNGGFVVPVGWPAYPRDD